MAFNLGSATVDISGKTKGLSKSLAGAKKMFSGVGAGISKAILPLAAFVATAFSLKKVITLYAAQEKAEQGLASALKATGASVDEYLPRLKTLASELQAVTTVGDEASLEAMRYGLSLGLTSDNVGAATKAAIGMSRAYGIDMTAAMRATAKEMQGVSSTFGEFIPELRGVEDTQERLAIISRLAADGMQQEQDMAKTTGGTMTQLSNALGDLGEQLGGLLAPMLLQVTQGLMGFVEWIQTTISVASEFGLRVGSVFTDTYGSMSEMGQVASDVFGGMLQFFKDMGFAILNFDLVIETIGVTFAEAFTNAYYQVKNFADNAFIAIEWFFNNFWDIGKTYLNLYTTAFTNLGENIKSIWQSALDFINGGEFKPNLKPMLEGFQNEIKSMPAFVEAQVADYSAQKAGLAKLWAERDKEWQKLSDKHTKKSKEEIAEEAKDIDLAENQTRDKRAEAKLKKAQTKSNAGTFSGLAQVWKTTQTNLLKKQESVPKKQLSEQQKTNKHLETIVGMKQPAAVFGT